MGWNEQQLYSQFVTANIKPFSPFQVDGYGFPTLEGLVGLYSDGVNERGYFMAVLEASRECLMKNHDKFSRTVPMGRLSLSLSIITGTLQEAKINLQVLWGT